MTSSTDSASGRGAPAFGKRMRLASQRTLAVIRSDRRVGAAVAIAVAASAGLIAAWLMPRGPVTNGAALATIALTFAVGVLAGAAMRSRWAMLIAPLAFIALFELGRLGTDGPLVDGIRVGSTYGIIALIVGRGFLGLLALAPMALGVAYGKRATRWLQPQPAKGAETSRRAVRWGGLGLIGVSTLALLVLTALIARPASTAPVLGLDGQTLPGSIAELTRVELGGHDQALMIRGYSMDSPVLLYLAGGPGGTDIGAMRIFGEDLERDFVVVTWDQRGAGKSYAALDPTSTLTLERVVADTIELTEYLRERFGEERIYVVGNSWGATLGVLAVQERPELYHAYIGTGQMVSQRETDIMFYEDALAWAEAEGNHGLVATLLASGPPPHEDLWTYEPWFGSEREWNDYVRVPEYNAKGEMPANLFVREYTLLEQVHALAGFLDTFAVLYPQLQEIDFRATAASLNVPVYMVLGAHEARGRAVLANEWFGLLEAPTKTRFVYEHSGHRPHFEEPDRFADVMAQVLRETYPGN